MLRDRVGKFWIVTAPRLSSTLPDICFETTVEGFALQVLGGLDRDSVVGFYRKQDEAESVAEKLVAAVREAQR